MQLELDWPALSTEQRIHEIVLLLQRAARLRSGAPLDSVVAAILVDESETIALEAQSRFWQERHEPKRLIAPICPAWNLD